MVHIQSGAGWITDEIHNLPIEFVDGDRSNKYPKRDEFVSEGIPFLNAMSINQGYLELSKANFITAEKFDTIKKGRLQQGDLILTTRGNGVGNAAYFSGKTKTGLINAQLLILRPNPEHVFPRFLYYLFISPYVQDLIRNFVSGSAQPQLPIQSIRNIKLSYPPLSIQRKIAAILSAYDDLIENNTRRIQILEEMAQNLYREWFVYFRFPGHEKVRMVDSELGPIPEGWKAKRLGDLAKEVRRGVNPDEVDPETPYFGLEHLPRKSIALSEWGTADQVNSTKLAFRKGEILFGKIRPYFHKVGVAPVNGICSSDTIVISPKEPDYFSIVLCCVSSEDFVNHATQTSQGTKMPRANWKVLVNYPIMLPPDPLRSNFDNLVQDIVSQIQNMIYRNRNLRLTRDFLLPKLISGEVDVENLDIDTSGFET